MRAARLTINLLLTITWMVMANHCYLEAALNSKSCAAHGQTPGDTHHHGQHCSLSELTLASRSLHSAATLPLSADVPLPAKGVALSFEQTASAPLLHPGTTLSRRRAEPNALAVHLSPAAPPLS